VFNRATLAGTLTYAGFKVLSGISQTSGLDFHKVAVLYEDGAYGTSGNEQATKAATDAGVEITARIAFHTRACRQFT
jgi:branched-chain amino acid transport system substrate-binding protein